jgi:hypothetical protein
MGNILNWRGQADLPQGQTLSFHIQLVEHIGWTIGDEGHRKSSAKKVTHQKLCRA